MESALRRNKIREEYIFCYDKELAMVRVHFGCPDNPCWVQYIPDRDNYRCKPTTCSLALRLTRDMIPHKLALYFPELDEDVAFMRSLYDNADLIRAELLKGLAAPSGSKDYGTYANPYDMVEIVHYATDTMPHRELRFKMPHVTLHKITFFFGDRDAKAVKPKTAQVAYIFESFGRIRIVENDAYKNAVQFQGMFEPYREECLQKARDDAAHIRRVLVDPEEVRKKPPKLPTSCTELTSVIVNVHAPKTDDYGFIIPAQTDAYGFVRPTHH